MNTKKLLPLLALAGLLAVTLAACTSSEDSLDGTSWMLTALPHDSLLPDTAIDLNFQGDELSGSAGCNHYFGSYQINGSEITISDVGATEMFCVDPDGIMEQESGYLAALSDAETFQLSGKQLQIVGPTGDTLTYTEQ
jgi:heat shock protein HslJ